MKNIFVFSCVALALSACSSPHDVIPGNSNRSLPTSIDWQNHSTFANSNNPFDSAGWYHNDCLHTVATQSGWSSDTNQLLNSVERYMWGAAETTDSITRHKVFLKWTAQHADSLFGLLYKNSTLQGYFDKADGFILSTLISPEQRIDSLRALEDQIVASSDLATIQKGWILGYSAVARYSTAYWTGPDTVLWPYRHTVQGTWSKGSRPASSGNRKLLGTADLEKTVLADAHGFAAGMVEGFLTGIVAGAIAGSIGGPAGTLGGAAGGAVVGSLGGGVAQAALSSGKEATGWKWPWE
jgi:hypothetical protein